MAKRSLFLSLIGLLACVSTASATVTISQKLSGKILLQVQDNGEGWYVNPGDLTRYYLGRPADAFKIMRELGLGISNKNFDSYKGHAPKKLSGKILLKVQDLGKAYYVNPADLKMHYLGRPADAFKVMKELGLGITNIDLNKITVAKNSALPKTQTDEMYEDIAGSAGLNPISNLPESNPFEQTETNPFANAETNPFK